jgi:hypothetical protein
MAVSEPHAPRLLYPWGEERSTYRTRGWKRAGVGQSQCGCFGGKAKTKKAGTRIADLPARSPRDNTEHGVPLGGRPQGGSQYGNTEKNSRHTVRKNTAYDIRKVYFTLSTRSGSEIPKEGH